MLVTFTFFLYSTDFDAVEFSSNVICLFLPPASATFLANGKAPFSLLHKPFSF